MKLQTESEYLMLGGNVFKVYAGKGKPIYPEILYRTYDQIEAMLSHYSRVLLVRIDIRNHSAEQTNRVMTKLSSKLKKRLNTKAYGFINRLGYAWAREQKTSEAHHYHLALMLDGHKVQHPHRVIELVGDICWRSNLSAYTPRNCYYLLRRSEIDGQTLANAIYRLSYLAKVNTKDKRPSTTHDYGTSRIKPRTKRHTEAAA
ncbi:YagK/YfjJ domain-containing protein [Pseudidiomarina sp.]|uniref:YagK/YfjJ domain-containing protein n=1 Tax=Pseudidiomarina sp. TaxID=2081707 RepID=UPI003A96C70D